MSYPNHSFNEFMHHSKGQNGTDSAYFQKQLLQNSGDCEMKMVEMQECLCIFKDIIADLELDLKILRTSFNQLSKKKPLKGGQS